MGVGHATSSHASSASSDSSESFAAPACGASNTIPEGAQWLCGARLPVGNGGFAGDLRTGAKLGAFPMAAGRAPDFLVRNASFDRYTSRLLAAVSVHRAPGSVMSMLDTSDKSPQCALCP